MEARKGAKLAGVVLIGAVGLIHLLEASEYFEVAVYVGLLFVVNVAGAALSGVGILRNRGWGWWLGALVAGGAFAAYIASRTVGLPGATALMYASFFEPSGIISLVVEFLFVALSVTVLSGRAAAYQAARNE
jgi:hypothetical protein